MKSSSESFRLKLLPLFFSAAVLLSAGFFGCESFKVTNYFAEGALATASPIATETGLDIMKAGGNAFDAAVAVGFTLAVVHPQAGNIGGGGFALLRDGKTGVVSSLDFRERAPSAATEKMYQDSTGEIIKDLSLVGSLSVGVPGTVAGMHAIWRKHGSLPWTELLEPAIRLAADGFIVDQYLADKFADYSQQLQLFEATKSWFMPNGRLPQAGEKFMQKELAVTLRTIAAEGPAGFYSGQTASLIAECMQINNGLITETDLADYKPIWRKPIKFEFDSLQMYGMAPPSSGGLMVGQILKLIEPYDFSLLTPGGTEFAHLFAESSRRAFADRSEHLGDPDYWAVPNRLLDDKYIAERRKTIELDQASNSEQVAPGNPNRAESDETTHYSVSDKDGNLVSITYTLNASFGSKLVVEGAGFLLNNEMDDFSSKPGSANLFGLVGAEANRIEPGKRMLSSMSPMIITRAGQPYMVVGSKGGSKIITTVAQVILNITRFGLTPAEAVEMPHIHHQWLPDQIRLEEGKFDVAFKQKLISLGHFINERAAYGNVQMILIDEAGLMAPVSDPRHRGQSAGF